MIGRQFFIFISLLAAVKPQEYEVPEAILIAYSPKGFQVSIPAHDDGMEIFAFHGNVNKEMVYPEAGEMSVDITRPKNGRWTYENPRIKLKQGDVINYWLYVQHRGRGYPKEDLSWTVSTLVNKGDPTLPPVSTPTPACVSSVTTVNGMQSCRDRLIFEDTFDKLERSKWQNVIQFGGEPGYPFVEYSDNEANCYVHNGNLHIKPTLQNEDTVTSGDVTLSGCTGSAGTKECQQHASHAFNLPPVQTAQLRTRSSFSFRYGRVEVRAKLPIGDWLFSEIGLKPTHNRYGSTPKLVSGQINFALMRGNRVCTSGGKEIGARILESNCEMEFANVSHRMTYTKAGSGIWADDFHKYELLWTPDNIKFSVDGNEVGYIEPPSDGFKSTSPFTYLSNTPWALGSKMAPFDKEFYLSIGLGAGGVQEFPDGAVSQNNKRKPWINGEAKGIRNFWLDRSNWYPTWSGDGSIMLIDYVRVWAL